MTTGQVYMVYVCKVNHVDPDDAETRVIGITLDLQKAKNAANLEAKRLLDVTLTDIYGYDAGYSVWSTDDFNERKGDKRYAVDVGDGYTAIFYSTDRFNGRERDKRYVAHVGNSCKDEYPQWTVNVTIVNEL